jgi:hypothetical protein
MRRLLAILFVLALSASGAAVAAQVQWQWSESPSVRIGVRDKNDDHHGYKAAFVVTSERVRRLRLGDARAALQVDLHGRGQGRREGPLRARHDGRA